MHVLTERYFDTGEVLKQNNRSRGWGRGHGLFCRIILISVVQSLVTHIHGPILGWPNAVRGMPTEQIFRGRGDMASSVP